MQAAFISKAPRAPEEKILLLGLKKFKGVYPLEREGERGLACCDSWGRKELDD